MDDGAKLPDDLVDDTRIAKIRERLKAVTAGPLSISRYEHGGGRVYKEAGSERELVADLYNAGDREFYYHAALDVEMLLGEIESLRDQLKDCRKSLEDYATG